MATAPRPQSGRSLARLRFNASEDPGKVPPFGGLREARLGDVQASEVSACAHQGRQVSSALGSSEVPRQFNKGTVRLGDIIAGQRYGGLLVRQLDLKDRQSAVTEAQFTT